MRNKIRWGLAVAAGLSILALAPRTNAQSYDRNGMPLTPYCCDIRGRDVPSTGTALGDQEQLIERYMSGPSQQQLDEQQERNVRDAERLYLLNHMWDRR